MSNPKPYFKNLFKKRLFLRELFFLWILCHVSMSANAANWLKLQGTEPPNRRALLWGFVQPSYTEDFGEKLSNLQGAREGDNGKLIAQNTISPFFDEQSMLHVRRARLGFRGRIQKTESNSFFSKINYFLLTEFGSNQITHKPFGERDQVLAVTDLSLTFNHIPGARLRMGLFKKPGPEELFQAIHVFDYIEFTDFIAREMLERFPSGNLSPALAGNAPNDFTTIGTPVSKAFGFGAGRDWGIQLFDFFQKDKWELSYAFMAGNGGAIGFNDMQIDKNFDLNFYASANRDLPGGHGPRKNGAKFFAWYQTGDRFFSSDPQKKEYNRTRYGFGMKALGELMGFRQKLSVELMFADGMLFVNPLGGIPGNALRFAAEKGNMARGLTIDYGFFLGEKWQFDFRYGRNNLLYKQSGPWTPQDERIFQSFTVGAHYHFTPKLRLTFNYIHRKGSAPNPSSIYNPQANALVTQNVHETVSTLGDRISLQLTWIFEPWKI
ncbi:MAG: hypothetical protein MRK00_13680 [Nitrosomonas sp.]|nr:hypothetical protein [Nitrosomonas sp.]